MANNSSMSWLGILALLVLVGVVVYFVTREQDDSELEIDIGMTRDVPVDVSTFAVEAPHAVVAALPV